MRRTIEPAVTGSNRQSRWGQAAESSRFARRQVRRARPASQAPGQWPARSWIASHGVSSEGLNRTLAGWHRDEERGMAGLNGDGALSREIVSLAVAVDDRERDGSVVWNVLAMYF